jgi:2-aminoadipate transaminase
MFVWATPSEGYDSAALLRVAIQHDVAYVPGAPFYAGRWTRRRCG